MLWYGRANAAETFGVSRQRVWRCLQRDRPGLSLPKAVTRAVGHTQEAIEADTWAIHRQPCRRQTGYVHLGACAVPRGHGARCARRPWPSWRSRPASGVPDWRSSLSCLALQSRRNFIRRSLVARRCNSSSPPSPPVCEAWSWPGVVAGTPASTSSNASSWWWPSVPSFLQEGPARQAIATRLRIAAPVGAGLSCLFQFAQGADHGGPGQPSLAHGVVLGHGSAGRSDGSTQRVLTC